MKQFLIDYWFLFLCFFIVSYAAAGLLWIRFATIDVNFGSDFEKNIRKLMYAIYLFSLVGSMSFFLAIIGVLFGISK